MFFCLHKVKAATSNRDLWEQISANGVRLLVVTSGMVHTLAKKQPLQKIKHTAGESGYTREGYKDGYRNLPVRELTKSASGCLPIEIKLWGFCVKVKPLIA